MQVNITCSMNRQQYGQWYQLYTQRKKGKLPYWVALKQVSVLGLIVLCCLIDRMYLLFCGFVILVIQGDLVWNYYLWPWREWNLNKECLQKEEQVLATEDGLQFIMTNRKIDYRWAGFVGIRVIPEAIYLYHQYNRLTVFPRFWFSNESDWNSFVELASKSIQVQPSPDKIPSTDGLSSKTGITGG